MSGSFVDRDELADVEWDNQRKDWVRPDVDRSALKELSKRSTGHSLLRLLYFVALLAGAAAATVYTSRIHLLLALPTLYFYFFVYGFWVAPGHELQHQIVFARSATWLSEIIFYLVQALMWNSPTYARVSHRLHHRYTMVRGVDPETEWPEVVTSKWLQRYVMELVGRILVVWAVVELVKHIVLQVKRACGMKDRMMREHCTEHQVRAIQIESISILIFHVAIAYVAISFQVWWLLVFVTIAWQIGSAMEWLWHATKHIARPFNVKDHRINTRSIKVSPFIRSIFWGLDHHVDHHLYPGVPSKNLPELHRILEPELPDPDNIFGCWAEMFEIARTKDSDPQKEFVSTVPRKPGPADLGKVDHGARPKP